MKYLALLALLLLAVPALAGQAWLQVFDQEGRNISKLCVIKGARADLYNATHLLVWLDAPARAEIWLRGAKVYNLTVEPGRLYKIKVLAGRLIVRAPRDVHVRITILKTGEVIEGDTFRAPFVDAGEAPYGLILVEVKGTGELKKVINWKGGPVTVGEYAYLTPPAYPILGISAVPAALSAYLWRRRRPKPAVRKPKPYRPRMAIVSERPEALERVEPYLKPVPKVAEVVEVGGLVLAPPPPPRPEAPKPKMDLKGEPKLAGRPKRKAPKPKIRKQYLSLADLTDRVDLREG